MGLEDTNVTFVLTSENEARLRIVAAQRGLAPEEALTALLTEAQKDFDAAVAGIRRGMADAEAGREISLEDYRAQITEGERSPSHRAVSEAA